MSPITQDTMKGEIPKHFDVFTPTMSQEHSCSSQNGCMPKLSKPRMKWCRNKTCYNRVNLNK